MTTCTYVFVARTTNQEDSAEAWMRNNPVTTHEPEIIKVLFGDRPKLFPELTQHRSPQYPADAVLPTCYDYLLVRTDGRLIATGDIPKNPLCVEGGMERMDLIGIVEEGKRIASQRGHNVVFVTPYRKIGSEFGRETSFGHFINSTIKDGAHIDYHGAPYCFDNALMMFELMTHEVGGNTK